MMISLINSQINIENELYCGIDKNYLDHIYDYELFSAKYREYKIVFAYREYILKCPVLSGNEIPPLVLIPSLKIPRKRYPVYVYLYAVTLYLSSSLSMRKICAEVRKIFGLETFSHSTLSRTLKKLIANINLISECCNQYSAKFVKLVLVRRKHWNNAYKQTITSLLNCLAPILEYTKRFSAQISYDFFKLSGGRFLF